MTTTPVSETIYASRDAIRTQVIDFLQQYMELNEVDLTQSSFLSYIIDILTTLSSNLMFYQSNIYREFFLTQAQLPESIHNLSSFLGYSPKEAKYATANLLMKVWLPFTDPDTTFNIPSGFTFKTGDGTIFLTYYKTTITLTNNTHVKITIEEDGKVYNLATKINTTTEPHYFQFILPVRQYKITRIETGVDEDIQPYQFTDKNIAISGKIAEIDVYVKEEKSSSDNGTLYTQFNSLYLMSSSDYGYVLRVSSDGRRIYFGNNIIGVQPKAGSKIIVYVKETLGSAGNVIAGSITKGERIYSQQTDPLTNITQTTLIDYEVINPSPAFGGEDEEDLQEIRNNSIKSLVSLGRLVSEDDYKNFDVVIPDAPVKSNSIPVLKRSDLKINEIQLFTIFEFGDVLVPSKNVSYEIDSTLPSLPRYTVITKEDVEYITLFEMTLDIMNEAAYYEYIMTSIDVVPTLVQSWLENQAKTYNFNVNKLEVVNNGDSTTTFRLYYYSTETDFNLCECTIRIASLNREYSMTNFSNLNEEQGVFYYTFMDHLEIPAGNELFYFTISNPYTTEDVYSTAIPPVLVSTGTTVITKLAQYSTNITYRKNLKAFMISNTIVDGMVTTIYDIPVIQKKFYDDLDVSGQKDFELQVLQQLLTSADFKSYRMLTDFINLKLCNTTGKSINMLKNSITKDFVKDIGSAAIPPAIEVGIRYIVSGNEGGSWSGQRDKIAVCTAMNPDEWIFLSAKSNDIVYIENKHSNYIYTEYGWMQPIYDIPLKLNIEVFKVNDSSIGETDLVSSIKKSIIDYYKDDFGPKLVLRRSKIIDIIHNTVGVNHCRLITPQSDIFFDFNIDDFEQQELMEYTPEWIYFTEDDITVKIFTLD